MAVDSKPPNRLEHMLAVHVAALTVLGALIVGLRHDAPWLPAITALVAVLAVVVTDWLVVVRLNRWLANAITILAVIWSLRDFWDLSSEEKLMAIGSMLCLLQMILVFQEKTSRIYWHLVVLSVLEVVVAAALDLGPSFVPFMAVFVALGLATLTLLCAYREVAQAKTDHWSAAKWLSVLWRTIVPRRWLNRLKGSVAHPANATISSAPAKISALSTARLLLARPNAETENASFSHWLSARLLFRQTAILTAVTMAFTVVFFYATPRLRDGFSPNGFLFGGASTGFRSEIRLPRKARIHLSEKPVMRVKLSRLLDQRTIELNGEVYFHGAILSEYISDAEGSRWVRPPSTNIGGFGGRGNIQAVARSTRDLVRQDIVVEPNVSRRFAIQPVQPIEDPTAVYGSSRGGNDRIQQRYSWATPAILRDKQVDAIPNPNRRRNTEEETLFQGELLAARRFPAERFPRLAAVAADVIAQNQLANGRSIDKAQALWRHFLTAGQYQYTLNLNLSGDETIDPIEDFVATTRAGNCEYFASSLAMMLRSQGIPARLVRGYKGGTFNTVGRYYLVQERDAHSWVEAWIPTDELVSDDLAGAPSEGGAWYRLDPTPGRTTQIALQKPGVGDQMAQAFDYVELLWRDYVLSLNTARQDEIVYDPLTARAGALPQWVEMRRVRYWLRRAGAAIGFDSLSRGTRPSRVFEGPAAVAVILALLILSGAIYGARLLWAAIMKRRQSRRKITSAAPEFYRQLERLLARVAVVRNTAQTPREMADAARNRLEAIPGAAAVASLPHEVVDVYYRLRFGKGRLDKVESQAIEQALSQIEGAVQRAN